MPCWKTLESIVSAAKKNVGASLPSLESIYTINLIRKALCIGGDPSPPSHSFFGVLPSGRRLWVLRASTNRHNDFIGQAVRKLNSLLTLSPLSLLLSAH